MGVVQQAGRADNRRGEECFDVLAKRLCTPLFQCLAWEVTSTAVRIKVPHISVARHLLKTKPGDCSLALLLVFFSRLSRHEIRISAFYEEEEDPGGGAISSPSSSPPLSSWPSSQMSLPVSLSLPPRLPFPLSFLSLWGWHVRFSCQTVRPTDYLQATAASALQRALSRVGGRTEREGREL